MAITRSAPITRTYWLRSWPSGPRPIIATVAPMASPARRTPVWAMVASFDHAADSSETASGILTGVPRATATWWWWEVVNTRSPAAKPDTASPVRSITPTLL